MAEQARRIESEKFGESVFLANQAEDAQDAIKQVVKRMKEAVVRVARDGAEDGKEIVGGTVRGYPLAALGAAAAGGFLAGSLLVESKKHKVLRQLGMLEKAMALAAGERVTFAAKKEGPGTVGRVLRIVLRKAGPAAMAAVAGKMAEQAERVQGSGFGVQETQAPLS